MNVDELVQSIMPMVRHVARDLAAQVRADFDDLVADGYLGAVKAAKAFDPERGLQFATYAHHRVRGEMIDGLRRMDYAGRKQRAQSTAAWKAAEAEGREYLDFRTAPPVSLDILVTGDDGSLTSTLGNFLADSAPTPEDALADSDVISWALAHLYGREAEVIRRLYWDDEDQGVIARDWQVSLSRVSQLHAAALHSLRLAFLSAGIDAPRLTAAVNAVTRGKRKNQPRAVEHAALFGDLLAYWSAA